MEYTGEAGPPSDYIEQRMSGHGSTSQDEQKPETPSPPLAFSFPLMTTSQHDTLSMKGTNNYLQTRVSPAASPNRECSSSGNAKSISHSNDVSSDIPAPKTPTTPRTSSAQHKQMRKFARSADKRQSVHMLGSIQHLQRHFMRFGQEETDGSNVKPDVGSFLTSISSNAESYANNENDNDNANIAVAPATVAKPPFPLGTPKVDLGKLRREAFESLKSLEEMWRVNETQEPSNRETHDGQEGCVQLELSSTNILDLLKTTVDAIRAVRAWSLAVPATSLIRSEHPQHEHLRASHQFASKPRIPTISTPSRPAPQPSSRSASGTSMRLVGRNADGEGKVGEEKDSLSDLRKAALNVLACLRGVEEKFRVDDVVDSSPEGRGEDETHSRLESMSLDRQELPLILTAKPHISERPEDGPSTLPNKRIEESEDLWFFSQRVGRDKDEWTEEEKKGWYERLSSGEAGWSYRDDVRIPDELPEETEVVRRYLETVVKTFFGADALQGKSQIPWRSVGRNSDQGVKDDDLANETDETGEPVSRTQAEAQEQAMLPTWLDSQVWAGRPIERIRALLEDSLPSSVLGLVSASGDQDVRMKLLTRLSDGYLLTLAFNTVLGRSAGSWGFIPDEDVYDTLDSGITTADPSSHAAEYTGDETPSARRQKDYTFRKAGNLRCWGAALKLRYGVPLTFPIQAIDLQPSIPLIQTTDRSSRSVPASRHPSPSPSRRASNNAARGTLDAGSGEGNAVGIAFDPVRIARREEGWDRMLEAAVAAWVDGVSSEVIAK
ncbi:hypothetical protein QFC19_008541 [Naganishia cerealis]|uniref:Uncharacterized protein n=1 Tax=Naganishia cerealis TaxID=610337 RepID=A0ACC2V1H0_9TREE|nr:hypothetical protein QFC19_008541 [Naganishia cerealis]